MATIAEIYSLAVQNHQNGHLAQAAALYQQILQTEPSHPDALNNLGILLFGQGAIPQATECFWRATQGNPNFADAHNNLGSALKQLGRPDDAVACYRNAIAINPNHVDALSNLGLILKDQGRLGGAIECYKRALQINPNHVDALNNLGVVLQEQGQLTEAIACHRQALALNPNHADAHNSLGYDLIKHGELSEARKCFQQALAINPHHASALNNLGVLLQVQEQYVEAIACHRQALVINPNQVDAHNNLGYALYVLGELDEACASYRQALRLNPQYAEAHQNLGIVLFGQGRLDEAAECYRQTLRIDPGQKKALWNFSVLRLLQGNYLGAWPDYELRWMQTGSGPRTFEQPRWDGAPLDGRTILVHAEQGLGDTIQFARYLSMIQRLGGTVLLECQAPLVKLLADLTGADRIFSVGAELPPFDVHIPLMSLAWIFGTTLLNIPNKVPYLRIERSATFSGEPQATAALNIGIVWQGNPRQIEDRYRSVPLAQFAPLAKVPGVKLFSLQVGPGAEQLAQADFPITDLGSRLDPNSLHDLAAMLPNLDLVVTVCTSVAHLAGAMGIPCWVALRLVPHWSWGPAGAETPWYPTVRLFRQNKAGEWSDVFERIAAAIPMFSHGSKNRAETNLQQGNHFMNQGQPAEATVCYRAALRIDPSHSHGHNNLGLALLNQGHVDEAKACFREALRLDLKNALAYFNLGNVLKNQGSLEEAAACYRQGLELHPGDPAAHNNLGVVLKDQGRLEEAILSFRRSLGIDSKNDFTHVNLGNALQDHGQLTEAAECYREALCINPENALAHHHLGDIFVMQGKAIEAAQCYRQAFRCNPKLVDALSNLGHLLVGQKRFSEAADCFQEALRIDPGNSLALWNRCLLRLLQGDFEGGWPDYEQRWQQPGMVPRSFQEPRWDGASLAGKTMLIFAEQGLGDTLQFIRYVPWVKRKGGTVLMECQPALAGLVKDMPEIDQIVMAGKPLPPFDVQVPLLSVPGILGTTLSNIPAQIPYLRAQPEKVEFWRKQLEPLEGVKIGIVWQGNPQFRFDKGRSIPLRHFEELAFIPGVRLVSLQVGPGTKQLQDISFPITDLGSRFDPQTLDDLAGALMNLDLVVSSCTAVPHLAGALGVPTWVALSFVPDWRWLMERTDSPWYPTMRLFRQRRLGDWNDVFERIAGEIRTFNPGSRNRGE